MTYRVHFADTFVDDISQHVAWLRGEGVGDEVYRNLVLPVV